MSAARDPGVLAPGPLLPGGRYLPVKRAIDLCGAWLLLILTLPLLGVALVLTWLDSGAPVLHRRRVVGLGGVEFDALKIRTMVPDADRILAADERLRSEFARANKLVNDPRVTRLGHWLRRSSLDELPQLVNVLRGEMSLVGPRMITAAELPAWGETAALRLLVRPGITGLWQVSGRHRVSKQQRVLMDGEYVRTLSLVNDLRILARTIRAVVSAEGAC